MNLEKEFTQIGSTVDDIKPVVYDLYRQKEELEKKIHLFNILSFTRGMVEFLNSVDISSYNVSAVKFRHYRDFESGGNNIMLDLLDLKGQTVESETMDEKQGDVWSTVLSLLSSNALSNIDESLINQEFKENIWMPVSLLNNTEEAIMHLFLSKELKSVLDFNKMHSNLPSNNVSGKKSKV